MDICRLYGLIRLWEVALTLTKPNNIQSIKLKPIIENNIECYGEGRVYGSIEFTLEREDTYAKDTIIDIHKEYRTIEEGETVQKETVLCLIDYLEQFLKDDAITLIWDQIDELDLNWYEKPHGLLSL